MIIELFKSFQNKFTFPNLEIKECEVGEYLYPGQHLKILFYYHEKICSEKLRLFAGQMDDDCDDIKFVTSWGFYLTNEIDCSKRKKNRFDTIIYWFELYVPPDRTTKKDKEFIKEYFENPYGLVKVYEKYKIY